MATTEEVRKVKERAEQVCRDAVTAATLDGKYPASGEQISAALLAVATSWRAEAVDLEGSTKRGAVGRQKELRAAAALVAGVGVQIAEMVRTGTLHGFTDLPPAERATYTTTDLRPQAVTAEVLAAEQLAEHEAAGPHHALAYLASPDAAASYMTGEQARANHPSRTGSPAASLANLTTSTTANGTTVVNSFGPGDVPIGATVTKSNGTLVVSGSWEDGSPLAVDLGAGPIALLDPTPPPQRMTWAQFSAAVAAMPAIDHKSVSQITSLAECGVAYALDRMARDGVGQPAMPAWWNVGGTAFHAAVELIERGHAPSAPPLLQQIWLERLHGERDRVVAESGMSWLRWRTAGKGLEGYDWWRVQGEVMLTKYLDYRSPEWRSTNRLAVIDGRPLIEWDTVLDVEGIAVECRVDQVWTAGERLVVTDLKAGSTKPAGTFQLGVYAHALRQALGWPSDGIKISGAYWDARSGSHDQEVDDLIAAHPWDEIVWRVKAAQQITDARAYLPRVSTFAGGCGSCAHNPICPARG